jgi:hypothetical protein
MYAGLVAAALAACGPSKHEPGNTNPDAARNNIDAMSTPSECFVPAVQGTAMTAAVSIEACAVWNNVANMMGDVTVTRTGQDLTLAFTTTGLTFTGTIVGNDVTLTYSALHEFTDNCEWRSTETLTGTVDPMTCVLTLSYDYQEMVAVASPDGCDTPCTGTADVSLQITPMIQ